MGNKKMVSFGRLAFQALPEMWSFQFFAGIVLTVLSYPLKKLISAAASTAGGAVTTANMRALLLSWRLPVIIVLGAVLVFVSVAVELFAMIHLTDDILKGEPVGVRKEIVKGFRSLFQFFTPAGVITLLFIFIAVPLCGVGFSVGLTRSLYIPNFIMDVILARPLYFAGYAAAILALAWTGCRTGFAVHGVLFDGLTPGEARRQSAAIVRKNGIRLFFSFVRFALAMLGILFAVYILVEGIPEVLLGKAGENMPSRYVLDVLESGEWSDTDRAVAYYRVLCAFAVMFGAYLYSIVALLGGSYFMLSFSRWYLRFTGRDSGLWPERPKKRRYIRKVVQMLLFGLVIAAMAAACGLFYNLLFEREEPVKLVAHRTGGYMASENSIEGLYMAMDHGCYASETDIQRTADGHYVINHDNDFRRLTGDPRAPKDMTLEEIKELRIKDTTGSGKELPVVTIEEMLDVIKGKIILFIELKGDTADRQMVDDIVQIVRGHDCVEDVALISLNYDIISYAETNYPEFLTGTLFFAGLGNMAGLNCDLIMIEEELASGGLIPQIHAAGKQAVIWTVNKETSLETFLDSEADAVITDDILLAEKVQARLDARTYLEVMKDKLGDVWR